jgi:predicted NBD/HSP70 family sugar kinase
MKSQPTSLYDPETLTTDQLITAWQNGDVRIQAWAEHAASAIGLSLYNFLNILNINRYGCTVVAVLLAIAGSIPWCSKLGLTRLITVITRAPERLR